MAETRGIRKRMRPPACEACGGATRWKGAWVAGNGVKRRRFHCPVCRKYGHDGMHDPLLYCRLTRKQIATLREACESGASVRATVRATGITKNTVRRVFRVFGRAPQRVGVFRQLTQQQLAALRGAYLRCESICAAARRAGVIKSTARKWVLRFRAEEHAAFVAAFRARYAPSAMRRAA